MIRFVNGVAVKTGHRFRKTHDFGYVALDILYTYPEDSGTYMCKATNLAGEAVNTCTIKVGCKYFIFYFYVKVCIISAQYQLISN